MTVQTTYTFTTPANYSYNAAEIEVTGGVAQLIAPYVTSNPTILPSTSILTDELVSFAATITATGGDAVLFTVEVDGDEYWWNGSAWVVSTGYAEANTFADINTNLATLLSDESQVRFVAWLHSFDGTTTPILDSMVVGSNFVYPEPAVPPLCTIFGYVLDANGQPLAGVDVKAWLTQPATVEDVALTTVITFTTTDSEGRWSLVLVVTETIMPSNTKYIFQFDHPDHYLKVARDIPDNGSEDFANLT